MMPHADLIFASGAALSVRRFDVREALSDFFSVRVEARAESHALDLGAIVGCPAGFRLRPDVPGLAGAPRAWTGVCRRAEQLHPETDGLATYAFHIVPSLWLLTQRINHRIFQHLSIPDIADRLLGEWHQKFTWRVDRKAYPALEYKVQHGETDMSFLARLLEEAGITYLFEDDGDTTTLVLGDDPPHAPRRAGLPIPFVQHPAASTGEFLTAIHHARAVSPGAWVFRGHDDRRPTTPLTAASHGGADAEKKLERFHYSPGAFVIDTHGGGSTPVADDRGATRHDDAHGRHQADMALAAERTGDHALSFDTNVLDLRPGVVFRTTDHPHPSLPEHRAILVTALTIRGEGTARCHVAGKAVFADKPYRPARVTPRPKVGGVHPAIVVGPKGQEIHTDEFGRVRVQFPWDREGKADEGSSCWMRTSQGWGGRHYGWLVLPRVGHEVLIEFEDGDPDRPILIGRTYNATSNVPYKLPDHKTVSTWKSDSSPGSGGFNEIKHEDKKGEELFYIQAEKNLRSLVKHDDTSTVLRHRQKMVYENETDTTGVNRIEVTVGLRTEATGVERTTIVGGNKLQRIFGEEVERTESNRQLRVGKDLHWVTHEDKREFVGRDKGEKDKEARKADQPEMLPVDGGPGEEDANEVGTGASGDSGGSDKKDGGQGDGKKDEKDDEKKESEEQQSPLHQEVEGNRLEHISGDQSLTIGLDQFEKIAGRHALFAGLRAHLFANEDLMGEAPSITFKSKGGFVKIDAGGVTIKGKLVKINVGGSPGKGKGSSPKEPLKAKEADPFLGPVLRLAKTARARVQKVAHAVMSGSPVPGLAMAIAFQSTGKVTNLYKLAKGTPERDALMILLGQGRPVAQIRQILESGTNFQKRLFKKGEKLYGFSSKGAEAKAKHSAYWLDETTFEKVKAAHSKEGIWDTRAVQHALGLPLTNTAESVVVAEVTEDHEGVASEVLPAKAQMFGKDGDGGRWKETVKLDGGMAQVTPDPRSVGM